MAKRKLHDDDEPFLRTLKMVSEFAAQRGVPLHMACGIMLGAIKDRREKMRPVMDRFEDELAAIAEGGE